MGSHRADHRAPAQPATPYVGRRVAGRAAAAEPTPAPVATTSASTPSTPYVGRRRAEPTPALRPIAEAAPASRPRRRRAEPAPALVPVVEATAPVVEAPALIPVVEAPALQPLAEAAVAMPMGLDRAPTVELPALRDIALHDALADTSTGELRAIQASGKRRAVKHAGARGPLFRGLPSLPVAVGVATLAVAIGGTVVSADPQLASGTDRLTAANAMTGAFGTGIVGDRAQVVSRDSDRDALAGASGTDLVAQAERHAEERTSALGELAQAAEKEAAEIALNRWVLPIDSYRLTATFGEYGLWSSYHTGLDFAAPSGTTLRAVTNAVVTSSGYDGAYGLKTVLTLEDGTELWYCHQSAVTVSVGDTVRTGEVIGAVGSTGHVTGPHLHLEVRPGGGDPVDPNAALRVHGVTP